MYSFSYGNPLDPVQQQNVYVIRAEDQEVGQAIAKIGGECVLVSLIGARQTGKTSLLNRLHYQLSSDGSWAPIQVDLRTWNALQGRQWYQRLVIECQHALQQYSVSLSLAELEDHCAQQSIASPFSPQGWTELIYLACRQIPANRRLLVSLDSINRMPPEEWGPLFSQIRTIHEAAKSPVNSRQSDYRKFGMTLSGAFDPNQLITDDNSPFNVGSRIYMSYIGAAQLVQMSNVLANQGIVLEDDALREIYQWSGGMLYYIQSFCALIEQAAQTPVTPAMVAELAEEIKLNDLYLGFAQRRLAEQNSLARYAQKILEKPLPFNRATPPIAILEILGVIRYDPWIKKWCIANLFYEHSLQEFFDANIQVQLAADLKPSAAAALRRAIDFVFDDAPDLLRSIQQFGRTAGNASADRVYAPQVAPLSKADVLAWQPRVNDIEDLIADIDHALMLVRAHRRNKQLMEVTLALYGDFNQAPLPDRNQYLQTLEALGALCQDLLALLEKMYGRRIEVPLP